MSATYPILLDLSDRLVVIVGGGAVAARKARGLIAASDSRGPVRVVAPAFAESMPMEVERITDRYRAGHLDGAALVFAATDVPEANNAVVRDAQSRNILVSRVDDLDDGDFIIPAIHRDGPITITVSAGSPALSALIRDEIATQFGARWRMLADEMRALRPMIVQSDLPADDRASILRSLASREAIDVLTAGGSDALHAWLIARFPNLQSILHATRR